MSKFFNIYRIFFKHIRDAVKDYFINWRKNLKYFITANVKEKFIAVVLALLTFVYVRFQDVEQRNLFVPLQIYKNEELTFVNDLPKTVSIFVSGNRSALNNLDVNKIIARIDLTDITLPGSVQRSPILESIPDGIQVIRINPQTLDIELSNLEKKLLKIEATLLGRPHSDYRIQRISISPGKLWVFGPRDILNDITKIETEPIDIQNLNQDKEVSVTFSRNVHPGLKFDRDRRLDVSINIESEYLLQNLVDLIEVKYEFQEDWMLAEPLLVSNISYQIHKDEIDTFYPDQDLTFYFETDSIKQLGDHKIKIKYFRNKRIRKVSFSPNTATVQVVAKTDNDVKKK